LPAATPVPRHDRSNWTTRRDIRAPSVDAPSEAEFARAAQSPPEESIIRISKDEAWDE
jgi:hypothetical protein